MKIKLWNGKGYRMGNIQLFLSEIEELLINYQFIFIDNPKNNPILLLENGSGPITILKKNWEYLF